MNLTLATNSPLQNQSINVLRNVIFLNKIFVSEHNGVLNARAQQLAGNTGAILAKNAQTNYALSFKAYVACTQKAKAFLSHAL